MEQVLKLAKTGKIVIPIAILAIIGLAYAYVAGLDAEGQEELLYTVQDYLPILMFTTLAILLFSGVMERYPNIRFLFTEAGASWLIYVRERLDIIYRKHRYWTHSDLPNPPSFYLDRQVVNTFIEDTAAIRLRHEVGMRNLTWSTDYPHSGTDWPDSAVTIERVFQGVPRGEVRKMLRDNCVALYGLDGVPSRL